MIPVRPSPLLRLLYPGALWRVRVSEQVVYLSFDDGPVPEVTPWVLDQLRRVDVKATFFCIGNNVAKYPGIYRQILEAGHSVGNHTFNHVNGWKTGTAAYLADVAACGERVSSPLFRPPYGRMRLSQLRALKKQYRVILWDVLSKDYDKTVSPEQCINNVLDHVRPGSVIVFHDSVKAFPNLEPVLPVVLTELKKRGYRCEALSM